MLTTPAFSQNRQQGPRARKRYGIAIVSGVIALAIAGMLREDEHTEAPYFSGLSLLAQGNHRQAIREFTAAIAADPFDEFPYLRRALAYENVGNTHAAIADYRRALATARDEDTKKEIDAAIKRLTAEMEERQAVARRAAEAARRAAEAVPLPPAPRRSESTTVTIIRNMKREMDDTCVPCVERWWERDIRAVGRGDA
jgi:tetratricopeptide (TPR) repeat protein